MEQEMSQEEMAELMSSEGELEPAAPAVPTAYIAEPDLD